MEGHTRPRCQPTKVLIGKTLVAVGLIIIGLALSVQLIVQEEIPKRVKSYAVVSA